MEEEDFEEALYLAFADGYEWGNIDDFPMTREKMKERWEMSKKGHLTRVS